MQERYDLANGEQRFATDGAFAGQRIVKLGSDGFLDLAGASDENAIGVTRNPVGAATDVGGGPVVALRNRGGAALVEVAASNTITRGNVAYQAADGKVAATGTIRAGVAFTGGTEGQLIELMQDGGMAVGT